MTRSYVTGHRGMVGQALLRELGGTAKFVSRDFDLRRESIAENAIHKTEAKRIYLAAARVGGIGANATDPIGFLEDNLRIGLSVIRAAYRSGVTELLNLGSSCIYPRDAPQPLREEHLLTGPLERTNEAYAIAKIAVLKLVDYYRSMHDVNYISLMPTNLYGPGDRYDAERSHVIPAMILKFERARLAGDGTVELWGSGGPRREFLFVDDLAAAAVHVMDQYDGYSLGGWLNVGSGGELSIAELAELVAGATGYTGAIRWDKSRPDGTPRKLLDSSKIRKLGWEPRTQLVDGLQIAVEDYRRRHA